ncbi:LytR/AlgR family response regulator transcription factor [Lunatibacter salilacus]|uniref:LytR/AlgR family response regulator transcription factor n=1 Tax=Lunatibacter salilacus TaxID=2483804 RepID=UPI00131BDE91|nr:response regulator [Lunatibacter salilacus]
MSNPTKVLIVEDDPLLGDLIVSDLKLLFPYGEIDISGPAETYPEALELLHAVQPHIVLLDIELNGDTQAGIGLAKHINQTKGLIQIIFLSGLPRNKGGYDTAKYMTPFSFIQKPYQRQQLADQLELLLIRKAQSDLSKERNLENLNSEPPKRPVIFVTTAHGELTPVPIERLVLLEADGKIIRAYLTDYAFPIVFTSPGLKNFFLENEQLLAADFFQLSRKHVFCISKIQQIKHNQILLSQSENPSGTKPISIPIPQNGDARKRLYEKLGRIG